MNNDCKVCNGSGIVNAWTSADGDYDFDWCDCLCMNCHENKVSMLELYCLNCYLEKNAEIDYTQIDQLWLTKEAN